jgi:hypothetical protein
LEISLKGILADRESGIMGRVNKAASDRTAGSVTDCGEDCAGSELFVRHWQEGELCAIVESGFHVALPAKAAENGNRQAKRKPRGGFMAP